jgi:hypothetical protein
MTAPPPRTERALLVLAVGVALLALVLALLTPGFGLEQTLVYGQF